MYASIHAFNSLPSHYAYSRSLHSGSRFASRKKKKANQADRDACTDDTELTGVNISGELKGKKLHDSLDFGCRLVAGQGRSLEADTSGRCCCCPFVSGREPVNNLLHHKTNPCLIFFFQQRVFLLLLFFPV